MLIKRHSVCSFNTLGNMHDKGNKLNELCHDVNNLCKLLLIPTLSRVWKGFMLDFKNVLINTQIDSKWF